jgi:3-oxoacyl-[acyl-carrier protein] reductase
MGTEPLSGKVAIVTGASKGIGRVLACGLAASGASVVVNFKTDEAGADETCRLIGDAGGNAVPMGADVGNAEQVSELIDAAKNWFGRIDVLVNNAGRTRHMPWYNATEEDWDDVMDTNLRGAFLASVAAAQAMSEGGAIINISSCTASLAGDYPQVLYVTSKGALEVMTRQLAIELAPRVRVNALAPGATGMERTHAYGPEFEASWKALVPLGRVGTPEDYVAPLVFLASEASAYVTGQVLRVDGGWSVRGAYPDVSLFDFGADRARG